MKHIIVNQSLFSYVNYTYDQVFIYFSSFSKNQTGMWTSLHIDELRSTSFPRIEVLMSMSLTSILKESFYETEHESEETDQMSIPIMSNVRSHYKAHTHTHTR